MCARERGPGAGPPGWAVREPLLTERLRLEPSGEGHGDELARLAAMPEVVRWIGTGETWARPRALEVSAANAEHWRRHGFGWRAAYERGGGGFAGFAGANQVPEGTVGVGTEEVELGWWLAPEARGRGLAREAGAALRDEALERSGAQTLLARIRPENEPSIAVARALGFTFDFETTGPAGVPVAVYRLVPRR
jgi:[ribosomal protein S5]-alanine N-acetyltransferase